MIVELRSGETLGMLLARLTIFTHFIDCVRIFINLTTLISILK